MTELEFDDADGQNDAATAVLAANNEIVRLLEKEAAGPAGTDALFKHDNTPSDEEAREYILTVLRNYDKDTDLATSCREYYSL